MALCCTSCSTHVKKFTLFGLLSPIESKPCIQFEIPVVGTINLLNVYSILSRNEVKREFCTIFFAFKVTHYYDKYDNGDNVGTSIHSTWEFMMKQVRTTHVVVVVSVIYGLSWVMEWIFVGQNSKIIRGYMQHYAVCRRPTQTKCIKSIKWVVLSKSGTYLKAVWAIQEFQL